MKVGIDLGGSHVAIGLVSDDGKIIDQFEKDFTQDEKQDIMKVTEEFIVDEISKIKNKYNIEKVGMAVPGTVKDGIIIKAVNLGIQNYDLGKILSTKTGIPFIIKNDAKCAALGEYKYVIKDDNKNILFLTLGTGIGGAYIYNGELLEGHSYDGYEYGHMVVKENGIPCKCGKKGCFEKYGSILCFKLKVQERLNLPINISGPELRANIAKYEDKVYDLQENYLNDLSLGLSNLINIFEPDMIVIGGGFARFDYMFLDRLKAKLLIPGVLFNNREKIDIRAAKLGNDAGIIGASIL